MTKDDIPDDILEVIRAKAKEYWKDDREMLKDTIEQEKSSYREFQQFDFGAAAAYRDQIVKWAMEEALTDSWEDRLSTLGEEVDAFRTLHDESNYDDIPQSVLSGFKREAANSNPESFSAQLTDVDYAVGRFRQDREVNGAVGPIRRLLVDMENVIGKRVYNSNIQNYGPGGVWEGEGRSFRYPLTLLSAAMEERRHRILREDVPPTELITGYYKFGANELSIMRALTDIVRLIEREYGVNLSDKNRVKKDKA